MLLGIIAIFFAATIQRAFWSTLVLSELLNFESKGWLVGWTPPPRVKEFIYHGPAGPVKADLYLPRPERKYPGILLNHGVIDTGKDDPRRVYLRVLKSFSHVDPAHQAWNVKNLITFHLPEGWKLFCLIDQLMKYRRG